MVSPFSSGAPAPPPPLHLPPYPLLPAMIRPSSHHPTPWSAMNAHRPSSLQAAASHGVCTLVWHSRTPLQALQLAQGQLQVARGAIAPFLQHRAQGCAGFSQFPLQGSAFGSVMAGGSPLGHLLRLLREVYSFFAQPLVRFLISPPPPPPP